MCSRETKQGKDGTMTKAKTAASDEAEITYNDRYGEEQTHTVSLPLQPGRGEAILNKAEERGCPDIPALREQIGALPHANDES